jgi:anthranilate phosphoribosyltransferase
MNNRFHKYIKAVGTGAKHNYDLEIEDMQNAMEDILNNDAFAEQISAFLLGWRMKPETTDEFIGALNAFDKFVLRNSIENSIEYGYPFDGKNNNPYLASLIAKDLENHNLHLIITGDELQPAKNGITAKDIFANNIYSPNLHYYDRKDIFPQLSNLTQIRMRLGIRTGLNSIERLINPANSQYAFIGVFHKPFVQKYAKIFGDRYKKLIIVKGNEGTPEIFSKTSYWIVEDGNISEYKIDPKDFGIDYKKSWDKITKEESKDMINNPDNELIKLARLNSALILFVTDKVSSIKEGYELLD